MIPDFQTIMLPVLEILADKKEQTLQEIISKTRGIVKQKLFAVAKSKKYIDKMDKVLAKHYGFTEEELDFIINFIIKYMMSKELNKDK